MNWSGKKNYMDCPVVMIENDGRLSISGISTCIRPEENYDPLINWAGSYKGKCLRIDVDLESLNCRSVKKLFQTIVAADMNKQVEAKCVHWFYHDEEQEELGKMISSMVTSCHFRISRKS